MSEGKVNPFRSKEAPTPEYLGLDQGLPVQLMPAKLTFRYAGRHLNLTRREPAEALQASAKVPQQLRGLLSGG